MEVNEMENELIETGSLMIYQNEKGDTKIDVMMVKIL